MSEADRISLSRGFLITLTIVGVVGFLLGSGAATAVAIACAGFDVAVAITRSRKDGGA